MSTITVDVFFDSPGLLGVRLSSDVPRDPLSRFARKAADHGSSATATAASGSWLGGILALAGVGLFFGVVGSRIYSGADSSSSADPFADVEVDTRLRDARGGTSWAGALDRLGDELAPVRTDLQPFAVRSLVDVPRDLRASGKQLPAWLAPRISVDDQKAHDLGRLLAEHLRLGGGLEGTALIVDLPGSAAIAAGSALSSVGDIVLTMDNLPHPHGVVPSQETLAALLYWRAEIVANKPALRQRTPMPVFLLDANRLNPYRNEQDRFDNRSQVHLPTAAAWKALGVTQLVYVRPFSTSVVESDDLNAAFLAYDAEGLTVRHLGLDAVVDVPVATEAPRSTPAATTPAPISSQANGHSTWLWYYLMMSRPSDTPSSLAPTASYRTSMRPFVQTADAWDGGASHREVVWSQYAARPVSTSSGGSWGRSFHSSSSSGG